MSRLLVSKGLSSIWGCELASTLSSAGAAQMALFKRMRAATKGVYLDDGATLRHEGRFFMVLDLEDSERQRLAAAIAHMGGEAAARLMIVEDQVDLVEAEILSAQDIADRTTVVLDLDAGLDGSAGSS